MWVFSALTICSILIYGIVLTVLPRQYQIISDKQLDVNMKHLVYQLQRMNYEDAIQEIYNFCIQNNATAILNDGNSALNFGELDTNQPEDLSAATSSIATSVTFLNSKTDYTLVVSSISQTSDLMLNLMLRFLPVVLGIIVFLSFFSAFICSKVIVTPIAKISQISKRMTTLDQTWKCEITSSDEIGVLANSLNTMAGQLHRTMQELTTANQQLTNDVEKFKALEEQRKNFFAAVSHELKTPLTILKGQIENMILGYGEYQNHKKYLPETLKVTEQMEHLVSEIIMVSKMERIDLQNTIQEVSLITSINNTIQAILPLAQDKRLQIKQQVCIDQVLFVNLNLWSKALSNIIGNAVRHSPCGETIWISLQSSENGKVLVIENTGVLLPEEDLPYLFTRGR